MTVLFLSCSAVTVAFSTFLGFSRSVDAEALLLDFICFLRLRVAEELFFRGMFRSGLTPRECFLRA